MNALRRLLGHDDKFFDLLESSAVEAQSSVRLLVSMLRRTDGVLTLDELIQARRKDKRITEEITEQLCKTFVTPLEREDIEALSHALYRIPKTIEKFAERLLVSQSQFRAELFQRQATLLQKSTDAVDRMVRQLRRGPHLDKIQEENSQLHGYEGEADKLILELLHDLYSGRYDALKMIVLRDLYELLEKVIDRCRDAGNVIFQIALKNS